MDAARRQLPIAYAVGGGAAGGVVLDARQTEEFILTVAQTLLGLAVLIDLRFAVWEAIDLFGLFALGSTPHDMPIDPERFRKRLAKVFVVLDDEDFPNRRSGAASYLPIRRAVGKYSIDGCR